MHERKKGEILFPVPNLTYERVNSAHYPQNSIAWIDSTPPRPKNDQKTDSVLSCLADKQQLEFTPVSLTSIACPTGLDLLSFCQLGRNTNRHFPEGKDAKKNQTDYRWCAMAVGTPIRFYIFLHKGTRYGYQC